MKPISVRVCEWIHSDLMIMDEWINSYVSEATECGH